jgi:hypothetical protein
VLCDNWLRPILARGRYETPLEQIGRSPAGLVVLADDKQFARLQDDQIAPIRPEAIMNTKLKFAFEKETKGAVRYQEVGDDGALAFAPQVGTLYVRKSAMPDGKIPKTLVVTITGE